MKILPILSAALLAIGAVSAFGQGGGLGRGGSGGSGGGSQPPVRSGGGGGQSSPPVRGGGSGGGQSSPPVRSGGGQSSPPVRGGGGSTGGGGGSKPPVRGGGSSGGGSTGGGGGLGRGGSSGGGGGSTPPVRGGGGSTGGGGGSTPPVRGGGSGGGQQQPPPVRGGGSSGGGGLGRGGSGSGGGSQPPVRGGGSSGGSQPPVRGGGSNGQPPVRGGGSTTSGSGGLIGRGSSNSTGGRTGQPNYGSVSNINNGRSNNYQTPPPPVITRGSAISREANREGGRIERTYNPDHHRRGYYHYNRNWRDDNFCYPYYVFDYSHRSYPSPFYFYPHLPGYVSVLRIDFDFVSFTYIQGNRYNWHYGRYDNSWGNRDDYNRHYSRDLDFAVDDIYDSFRRADMRYIEDLIPYRGWVNIEVDRYAQYRINSDDYYDMMRDLVEGTDTTDYRIRRVNNWRGGASIEAEHVYRDPFGRTQRVRHQYGLQDTGRGYVISHFRIDN